MKIDVNGTVVDLKVGELCRIRANSVDNDFLWLTGRLFRVEEDDGHSISLRDEDDPGVLFTMKYPEGVVPDIFVPL